MKRMILALLIATVMTLPGLVLAAASHDHGSMHDMKGMDHGAMKMDDSMKMDAAMLMLPEQTVAGITAMVHMNNIKADMAKMGKQDTHHFMVMFKDAAGKSIEAQVAAVIIVDPSGKESEAIELPSMQGHSGANIILAAPGAYTFKVAAKLPGEKKVQYEFKTTLK
ncbi:MAG TPA: hypothetical protein DCF93_06385 [Desulfuromonas sp.]|nr:hypothetical protein [Desulfuromonas sp.]